MAAGNCFPTYDVFYFSLQTLYKLSYEVTGRRPNADFSCLLFVEELKTKRRGLKKFALNLGLNTQSSENSEVHVTSFDLTQRLHKIKLL